MDGFYSHFPNPAYFLTMVQEALDLSSLAAALTVTSEHAASQQSANIVAGEGELASNEPPTGPEPPPTGPPGGGGVAADPCRHEPSPRGATARDQVGRGLASGHPARGTPCGHH